MSSSILLTGLSELFREFGSQESVSSAKSTGPMLIQEYSRMIQSDPDRKNTCVFMTKNQEKRLFETRTFGIVRNGSYSTIRSINPGLSQLTEIKGSGLINLWHSASANQSRAGRTVLAGNITGQELIEFMGGDE